MKAKLLLFFVLLLAFLSFWELKGGLLEHILPSPSRILVAFAGNANQILTQALITCYEIILGILIGSLLGALMGLSVHLSKTWRSFAMPLMVASQAIPVFAIAPLLVYWFGFGLGPRIAMATLIVFFPLAMGFITGLARPLGSLQGVVDSYQTGPWKLLWAIRLPLAVPHITQGLRVSIATAPIAVLVGEWIGGAQGLGWLMLHARARFETPKMMACLLVICLIGGLFYILAQILCRALDNHYTS